MPKKKATKKQETEERYFWAHVSKCFEYGRTTQEERKDIAVRWMNGDNECYMSLAESRTVLPVALLAAALIDVEVYPFMVDGKPCADTILGFMAVITAVEAARLTINMDVETTVQIALKIINQPVDNPCGQPVDSLWKKADSPQDMTEFPENQIKSNLYPQVEPIYQ